jgi:putative membrane protein
MSDFVSHFLPALLAFAGYFGAAVVFAVAFLAIYTRLTPHREFELIVHGHNTAAALALGSSLVGFAIPLARSISQAGSLVEFCAWALVALIVQIAAYLLARLAHPNLSAEIEANGLAAAVWLAAVSLAAGLLSAAAMTG